MATVYVPIPPGVPDVCAEIVVVVVTPLSVWPIRTAPEETLVTVRTVPAVEVLMPLSIRPVITVGPVLRAYVAFVFAPVPVVPPVPNGRM